MGLFEKTFIIVNLLLAVLLCAFVGSQWGKVQEAEGKNVDLRNDIAAIGKLRDDALEEKAVNEVSFSKLTNKYDSLEEKKGQVILTLERQIAELRTENAELKRDITKPDTGYIAQVERLTHLVKAAQTQLKEETGRLVKEKGELLEANATLTKDNLEQRDKLRVANEAIASIPNLKKEIEDLNKQIKIFTDGGTDIGDVVLPRINGKVTGVNPDPFGRDETFVTITTEAGSKEAKRHFTFHLFRSAEGTYLGKAVVDEISKTFPDGSQILVAVIKEPIPNRTIRITDDAATTLDPAEDEASEGPKEEAASEGPE